MRNENAPIPLSFQCDARWDDMLGEGSKRLCTQCNTPVVDLSSLTEAEAAAVLATPGVCVNYIVRDGQVVYGAGRGQVDPRGLPQRREARRRGRGRRMLRWVAAAAATAAPGVATAGQNAEESSTLERVRDWVSSWFVDDTCSAPPDPAHTEPADTGVEEREEPVRPPQRTGGKPLPVRPPPPPPPREAPTPPNRIDLEAPGIEQAEVVCRDGFRTRQAVEDGRARLQSEAGSCAIVLYGAGDPIRASLPEVADADIRCVLHDRQIQCDPL